MRIGEVKENYEKRKNKFSLKSLNHTIQIGDMNHKEPHMYPAILKSFNHMMQITGLLNCIKLCDSNHKSCHSNNYIGMIDSISVI